MLGHRELTVEDYIAILKRRIWLIVACAFAFLVIAVVASFIIPPKYQSQTLILIEQPKVPEDYVKPVVSQDLGQRLASMREQILSRSRLEPIINRFNLYPEKDLTMDDRVALAQKDIGIKAIPAGQSSSMPGFFITFKAKNAQLAQRVCGEISSLFVTETQTAREETARGTTDFLKQQLADSKKSLDAQDARLAAFQQKYFGRLPDQEQSNSNTLQALTTQLDAVNQSLSRQQQNITFLQAMITQQSHDLQNAGPAAAAAVVDERRTQLRNLIAQRQALTAQYTSDYPDVVDINRKISDLQTQIAASAPDPATAPVAPIARPDTPQLQQLKAQLRSAELAMDDSKKEQQRITQQVRTYESRIESSPQVEAEYKQITRDHETALEFYNSLLKKLNDSSMATALEQRQQGEQFRVMDAPNLPDSPVFPSRIMFAAGGLIGGIIIGLLLTGWFEYQDTTLRTEQDIWAFTKLSTLAVISHIDGVPQNESTASRWKLFAKFQKPTESTLG
jgi:polysaccharide chain length determinant protein (PEP-CTERM system associated)